MKTKIKNIIDNTEWCHVLGIAHTIFNCIIACIVTAAAILKTGNIVMSVVIGILITIVTTKVSNGMFDSLCDRLYGIEEKPKPREGFFVDMQIPDELSLEIFGNSDYAFQDRMTALMKAEWEKVILRVQEELDNEPESEKLRREQAIQAEWEYIRDNVLSR